MRVLLIHTSSFGFRVTEATSVAGAGELPDELRQGQGGDALVCFCASEKIDEDDPDSVARARRRAGACTR